MDFQVIVIKNYDNRKKIIKECEKEYGLQFVFLKEIGDSVYLHFLEKRNK